MKIFHSGDEVRRWVWSARGQGQSVGLVPTIGALHEGHVSLVRTIAERCDQTVVTIFVNPTQFAVGEDLDKYPRTFEADVNAVREAGAAAVFAPTVDEMYRADHSTFVSPPDVAAPLDGLYRPGHFRGVTTVVAKLFNLVPATHAIFGSKDYQQWKVIEAMVRDLNFGIEILAGETIRDPDGLAMSSRNQYLSTNDRAIALTLSRALRRAKQMVDEGELDVAKIESQMREILHQVTQLDYAAVVDAETLLPIKRLSVKGLGSPAQALVAARVGTTRLIDNVRL